MRIKELPKKDRPREKALTYGIDTISDQELLAIIIGSGVKNKSALDIANSLLSSYLNLATLSNAKTSLLLKEFGLSQISALKLEATFEFHKRLTTSKYSSNSYIKTSDDLYKFYKYLEDEIQEQFILVMLDQKGRILREKVLYKGTNDSIGLNLREILIELLQVNTKRFALIHNHPNESPNPSEEDIKATIIIKEKAELLEMKFMDHLIIYKGGFYSFMNSFDEKIAINRCKN